MLRVSKGSVGLWCKNLSLTEKQSAFLKEKVARLGMAGRIKGALMNKQKKENNIRIARQESEKMISKLTDRDLFILGMGLYWAEGGKSAASRLSFTNSDPNMIKIFINFLYKIYKIDKQRIVPRVAINESHKKREQTIIDFWSKTINLPKKQFRKTSFVKSKLKKIYENHNTYYGTMSIRVEKSNALWYKILTSIDIIKEKMPA